MDRDRFEEPRPAAEPEPPDIVQEADEESFPASDPPARTVVTGVPDGPLRVTPKSRD